jgi:hypothetical protein
MFQLSGAPKYFQLWQFQLLLEPWHRESVESKKQVNLQLGRHERDPFCDEWDTVVNWLCRVHRGHMFDSFNLLWTAWSLRNKNSKSALRLELLKRLLQYLGWALHSLCSCSLSCPIVGSDESCDGAVKLEDSWEFLYVLFNKLDGQSYW